MARPSMTAGALPPDSPDQGGNRLSLQVAGATRLRSIALELVVQQNQLSAICLISWRWSS
jgi:hypothetical protein